MHKLTAAIFDTVVRKPRVFLALTLVFCFSLAVHAPRVKTADNVDCYVVENDDAAFYRNFKRAFVPDEFFIIAVEHPDIFSPPGLKLLNDITAEISRLPEVRDVKSLSNVDDLAGEDDAFSVRRFLQQIPSDPAELERLRERATSNPLYVNNVISADGKTAAIAVFAYDRPEDETYRKRLLDGANAILDRYRPSAASFALAGWTLTNHELSEILQRDMVRLIPLSYLFIAGTILFCFRSVRITALSLCSMFACVASTFGLFALLGIPYNNITCVVLPVAITLSMADAIHIFSHLDRRVLEREKCPAAALSRILQSIVKPCLFTSLTTAIGFLSLAVSEIPAVRQFAYMASSAMVFEFIFSFFLLPPLILFCRPEKIYRVADPRSAASIDRLLQAIWRLISRHYPRVLCAGLVIAALGAYWTAQVRIETDLVEYFWPSSAFRQQMSFVEERLGGVATLELSLKAAKRDAFKQPENLRLLDDITRYAKNIAGVDVALSFSDFIKEMNKAFHNEAAEFYSVPETEEAVAQYLLLYDSDDTRDYITSAYDHARVSLRLSEHSTTGQKRILEDLLTYSLQRTAGTGITARTTGHAVNYVNVADRMVDSQVSSFGTAVVIIGLLMMILLRSVGLGLLSLIPNVYPILLNFGFMGLLGIPLDTGTIMIASVALGIACDDTIHFLTDLKDKRSRRIPLHSALEEVLMHKGRAIFSSSTVLTFGFGVLALGSFVPVFHFGVLCTVVMATAVWADILITPSVLLMLKKLNIEVINVRAVNRLRRGRKAADLRFAARADAANRSRPAVKERPREQ